MALSAVGSTNTHPGKSGVFRFGFGPRIGLPCKHLSLLLLHSSQLFVFSFVRRVLDFFFLSIGTHQARPINHTHRDIDHLARPDATTQTLTLTTTINSNFYLGAVHQGRPQRRGEGVWSNADTCGQREGVKDIADVRKLVLFFIVSACFADTLSVI